MRSVLDKLDAYLLDRPTRAMPDTEQLADALAQIAHAWKDNPEEFEWQFKRKLQEALLAAAMLFLWDLDDEQITVEEAMSEQEPYLEGFVKDLPNLSDAQAQARARLYATAVQKLYQELSLKQQGDTMLAWKYNPEAAHCEDCKELDGTVRPAHEWAILGLYPRSGQTQCLMNCQCELVRVR